MSILGGNATKTGTGAVNPWAAKVTAGAVCPPWWTTASIIGVCEIDVAGVFSLLVHVARSAKSGRIFATLPSTKKGDDWIPSIAIHDAQLREAVHEAAIAAVMRAPVQTEPTPTAAEGLPF